jgi:cobyrinic acid a,c-diamide synthase
MVSLPRVVIAATRSGDGKTTVATGIMAALRARGLRVSPHKVGPDYIDPSYHAAACGVPGRNLDPWLAGEALVAPLLRHGARGADIAVIEGVMGLFDGAAGRGDFASTAHVARLAGAPVVLVVGAAGTSRSIAATVHGFASWDPRVVLAGVVLNQVSSDRHEAVLREALGPAGIPVLGALRREATLHTPSRHLGLVPAAERAASVRQWLPALRELVARHLDLDLLLRIARSAPDLAAEPWSPADVAAAAGLPRPPAGRRPRIAVAAGPAFTFGYAEHDELLTAAGADVVTFDPLAAGALPAGTDALVVGGGFPEVHVEALAANVALRDEVRRRAAAGMPVVAECAGLLWLGSTLNSRPQCGFLPADARMTGTLTLGYREATALRDTPLLTAGSRVRAHEFHHTLSEPAHGDEPAWRLADGSRQGWAGPSMLASYLHLHWAGLPQAAARLVGAARTASARASCAPAGSPHSGTAAGSRSGQADVTRRGLPVRALPGTALPGTALPGTALPGTALPGTALPGTDVAVGQVTLVGAGPGSADLITRRGWLALQSADVVISDRLVDPELTTGLRPGVVLIDAGKRPGEHRLSQEDISAALVAHARAGHHVVRLKGGDPFVFGRGGEEMLACAEAGICCSVVPGLSSATAAPALAGIPLTHRGVAQSFAVVSGHLPPGHPDSPVDWKSLARSADTLVLLMAVANMTSIAWHLLALGRPPGTQVACIERAATASQQVSRCTLGELAEPGSAPAIENPAVIVIGPTVSALRPRGGWPVQP